MQFLLFQKIYVYNRWWLNLQWLSLISQFILIQHKLVEKITAGFKECPFFAVLCYLLVKKMLFSAEKLDLA